MIPMEYDFNLQTDGNYQPRRNAVGWFDPRYDDYEVDADQHLLAWPERFPEAAWRKIKLDLGPYATSGQYQQSPTPRESGMFQREWWQVWEQPDKSWPKNIEYVVASLDSAFTTKERNDPSGFTVWGVYRDKGEKNRVIMLWAWRKHLAFSGPRIDAMPGESADSYFRRTSKQWGLMEWVKYSCEKYKVDTLLIEAKASGISAAQELSNRYGRLQFGVIQCPVKGDKMARALAVQWVFARAEMGIDEMERFPLYKYDDLTDSTTQAIRFLVVNGILISDDEHEARERDMVVHVSQNRSKVSFW